MRIAVMGGDMRYAYLAQQLLAEKHDVRTLFLEGANMEHVPQANEQWAQQADMVVAGWPVKTPLSSVQCNAHLLLQNCRGKKMLCGPSPCTLVSENVADIHDDEQMLMENAALTAEGAIYSAMGVLNKSIANSSFLVIGYGRIGKHLSNILMNLGAEVTVASRNAAAREMGYRTVETCNIKNVVQQFEVVFTTPPSLVMGEKELREVRKDALVIDLASAPYGVDIEAAKRLNVNAWREPALPGRYCPKSAAEVLLRAIKREVVRSERN